MSHVLKVVNKSNHQTKPHQKSLTRDIIKMDLKDTGWEGVDYIHKASSRLSWAQYW
jgi:hypothetical protein